MKKARYWLEWLFVSGFARLIPLIPFGLLRVLADFAGSVFYLADRRSRAVALANLEAAFGSEMSPKRRRQVARKSLQVFARTFLELFWTPRLNRKNVEKFVSFENPEIFRALLATKQESPTIGITPIHALLHDRTGARLFPFITLARPGGGYSVRVFDPLQFPPGTSYPKIAQTCWDGFEPIIRQHPEQWLWVYKHWRYLPASSDRPYPFYANRSERFDRELENQGR